MCLMLQLASMSGWVSVSLLLTGWDAMTPKISETYFQSLLKQTDALDAVSTISQFWSHRTDRIKPRFGLALPEYHCQLVLIYSGEVGNGGHVQFFENRGLKHVEDYVAALEATSLQELAHSLRQAADIHPDAERLHLLDQQMWEHSLTIDEAVQVFLRKNSNIVLEPERS